MMRFVVIGVTTTGVFIETPSLGGLSTKTKEPPLPMRQTCPRRLPTRYFKASGRADTYYILLKDDLEVVAAKGNLIIPRRNSTTGCSLMSYPGQIIIIIIIFVIIVIIIIIIIMLYFTHKYLYGHIVFGILSGNKPP